MLAYKIKKKLLERIHDNDAGCLSGFLFTSTRPPEEWLNVLFPSNETARGLSLLVSISCRN